VVDINRRNLIRYAAIIAGLTIAPNLQGSALGATLETKGSEWRQFHVADYSATDTPIPIEYVIKAFQRAMKLHNLTQITNPNYEITYDAERKAYFHVHSAWLK